MTLAKDEVQKIILSSLLLIGLLYVYFSLLLGPLKARENRALQAQKAIEPSIAAAQTQLAKVQELEAKAPATNKTVEQIKALVPEGAPVAWFPPRMNDFFKRHGIERCTVRMNNEFPDKEMPGFRRILWAIDLPRVEFVPLATAIAELENEEPLIEIMNLRIETVLDDPQFQRAVLTVSSTVPL